MAPCEVSAVFQRERAEKYPNLFYGKCLQKQIFQKKGLDFILVWISPVMYAGAVFGVWDIRHQDIVTKMRVGSAPIHLPPVGPWEKIRITSTACMKAVNIGMDFFHQ